MGVTLRLEKRPIARRRGPSRKTVPGPRKLTPGPGVAAPVLDARLEAPPLAGCRRRLPVRIKPWIRVTRLGVPVPPASPTGLLTARLVRKREQPFLYFCKVRM